MSDAIRIAGRVGRHSFINEVYEPLQLVHNGRPCWVAREVAPRYLFHSGKSRWVISKQVDDGSRCWAYVPASEGSFDPSTCQEPWVCCDDDGEWRADSAIQCTKVPASSDKFVQLRLTLEDEMNRYGLIQHSSLKALWRRLDFNGNNVVSLAEIDKLVVEMVAGGAWPEWLNNKPALMRAYKKTILKDGDGDDWVQKHEFHALLLNIFWFNKLWLIFAAVDTGADRRIDLQEFRAGLSKLGLRLTDAEATREFQKIDRNKGGQVLFVEFCCWVRNRVNPDASAEFDADIISGEKCGRAMRAMQGYRATHDHFVATKTFSAFAQVERVFKDIMQDNKRLLALWAQIDFNGNNIVSLAEIDKLVVEAFPVLNHKPALMRAYKFTIQHGNGDDWVQKKEFKALLGNLLYFNKLFWLFSQADDSDRRLNFQEFALCLTLCGCPLSEAEARREFARVDRNGGGLILFDEFCLYVTSRACPEALTGALQ